MDMLLVAVLVIVAGFGLHGYLRGMVRVLFSLAAVFLTIGLATALSPYTEAFLRNQTPLYDTVREKCTDYMKENIKEQGRQEAAQDKKVEEFTVFGMEVPKELQSLVGQGAKGLLEDAGVYEKAGEFVAEQILQRAAWTISFTIILIAMAIAVHVLDLIAKLPILNSINHLGGLAIGLLEGMIVVWLLFLVIVLCQGTPWGREMMESIQGNVFLKFLYDNNLIEKVIIGI